MKFFDNTVTANLADFLFDEQIEDHNDLTKEGEFSRWRYFWYFTGALCSGMVRKHQVNLDSEVLSTIYKARFTLSETEYGRMFSVNYILKVLMADLKRRPFGMSVTFTNPVMLGRKVFLRYQEGYFELIGDDHRLLAYGTW